MNNRDGKHIFITIFFKTGGRGRCCGGTRLCDIVFVPPQPSGSEGQTGDKHKERERLRRVLKQMGRIKCPSEVCTPSFFLCPFLLSFLSFFTTLAFLCPSFPFVQLFCLSYHIFPMSSSASFNFVSPFSSGSSFCVCLLLPLSLLFPLCLVLDMLPKTTSTLCFPLLTLECKRQREEEKELQKIDSLLWHVLTEKLAVSSCFLCLFNSNRKILTNCSNFLPLNLHFVPLTQFPA